mmetsp:Transcript_15453/g.23352  ORF Transcript_15453/g.23352 Transcript_15453/m.23352 type:complete len:308 (+) Transcript_15453:50-973(+)|eukprot:CAMPEP_0167742880 /NCGR_PEP_ID=MMETSP0110_2-20121227/1693_1 /TAXON_ID=629695 /ORGANISM="Gymnochlora sp., Strain CCMP2014" /LENGTH=307 /DNA_ID=CAMNT_0007627163 /DNA_START=18 /DNA_END=941 /DNA_ORIENTATION=+
MLMTRSSQGSMGGSIAPSPSTQIFQRREEESSTPPRNPSEPKDGRLSPLDITHQPPHVEMPEVRISMKGSKAPNLFSELSSGLPSIVADNNREMLPNRIGKNMQIAIPSFRREVSFVGKTEGFALYEPLVGSAQTPTSLLTVPEAENIEIPENKYKFDSEPESPASMPQARTNSLFQLDFSDTHMQEDLVLGSLPVMKEKPHTLFSREKSWDKVNEIRVYTQPEKSKLIKKHRQKVKKRKFKKKVRYACRQAFARSRPRIGGRFCSKAELEVIYNDPILSQMIERGQSVDASRVKELLDAQAQSEAE